MQIFVDTNYDFVGWRMRTVLLSALFILAGFLMLFRNGLNFSIDFIGGANIILRFQQQPPIDLLRKTLPDAVIQQYGKTGDNTLLFRLPEQKKEGDYAGAVVTKIYQVLNGDPGRKIDLNFHGRDLIADMLKIKDPDHKGTGIDAHDYYYTVAQNIINQRSKIGLFTNFSQVTSAPGVSSGIAQALSENTFLGKFNVLNQETVGPQVGKELQRKAILAVILSTLAMGAYIWIRFDFKFGLGAIICLIHDVLVAFAFLIMIRAEVSLIMVAAFLMIVGYSVNDTVVTYDRVRENLKKSRAKEDFATVVNHAINQTLSRTILTTGSVILVLIALLLFGGRVIHDFAAVLLVGCIAGTYSTIWIVPAFVIPFEEKFGTSGNLRRAQLSAPTAAETKTKKRANA